MFRIRFLRSLVAASRCAVKQVAPVRCLSAFTSPSIGLLGLNSYGLLMSKRTFATQPLTAKDILQRIEACGINDSGKEKIISDEVKNKNFAALREVGDTLVEKPETKELGILCYVQSADAGDMLSQFAVGNLYLQRYWQEKMRPDFDAKKLNDLMDKAKVWYDLSAKQGYVPAKVGLAKMLLEDPTRNNVAKAIEIYEEADTQAHNVDAIYNLGFIYYEGLYNIPKDRVKGFRYIERAAELGDVSACYFLGFAYHHGLFENDNPNDAVPTTSKRGEGGARLCEENIEESLKYLEKAATGGHSKALLYLHQMFNNGDGVEKNARKAEDYLIKSMRLGDPEAMFIRGNQLYSGENGVKADKKQALELFMEAGKRGNADAMCSAGAMIYNGEGQERDLKKAFEVYTNAAALGSLAAVKNIASMYLLGEGVDKDPETAANLMRFIEEEEKKKQGK